MTTTNGNDPVPAGTDEFHTDLDALAPVARHSITFEGNVYAVRHVLDLPIGEWLALLRIEHDMAAVPVATEPEKLLDMVQRRLALLVPSLSADVAARMTYRQTVMAAAQAWKVAKKEDTPDPPTADADPGSSTGSPVSAASSGGGPVNP